MDGNGEREIQEWGDREEMEGKRGQEIARGGEERCRRRIEEEVGMGG